MHPLEPMAGRLAPLIELLAPDRCAACDGPVHPPGAGWCDGCSRTLPWHDAGRCAACGSALDGRGACPGCRAAGRPWSSVGAALAYEEPFQSLIQRWKYPGDPALSRAMGHLLHRAAGGLAPGTHVVPVPQAESSWRGRGFSPSLDLARQLARRNGLPLVHAIDRAAGGATQVGLTAGQRRRNVARLFRPAPRQARSLAGHRVLLVDDVVTTTATAVACAEILLQADARSVRVLTLARAWGRGVPCTRVT